MKKPLKNNAIYDGASHIHNDNERAEAWKARIKGLYRHITRIANGHHHPFYLYTRFSPLRPLWRISTWHFCKTFLEKDRDT